MTRLWLAVLLVVSSGCGLNFVRSPVGDAWRQAGPAFAPAHHFEHVLIIVLENQNYRNAISDPYLKLLAQSGANFTDFHGLFHPSYSNYLAMITGKELVTHFDRQKDFDTPTIAELLEAKGLTWKNYAENYPGNCFTGARASSGLYARKHVPFLSFPRIRQNGCSNVVEASQFRKDVEAGSLPAYAFYSPNMDDDGHSAGLTFASNWLRGFLEPLRQNPAFMKDTLTVVTFDESAGKGSDRNHIYTVFVGEMVKPGDYASNYNHFNVLRTIEDNFALGTLAEGDGAARPISEVWK